MLLYVSTMCPFSVNLNLILCSELQELVLNCEEETFAALDGLESCYCNVAIEIAVGKH